MGLTWPQFLEEFTLRIDHRSSRAQEWKPLEKSGFHSQNDFRIILPNGTVKHRHSVAHSVRDNSGANRGHRHRYGCDRTVEGQRKSRSAFEEIKQRTAASAE